jgi:GDP-L-fucose synthase
MNNDSRILVAGAKGMVGSAIIRHLQKNAYTNIVEATRKQVDFTSQVETQVYMRTVNPDYVFVAAARVGGILGNRDHKAQMIYENLMIQNNIIDAAYQNKVEKLLFLGSSCIYPKFPNLPITEDQLLTGPLELSNDSYAIAKIAGIKMCESYRDQYGFNAISLMPCNLYGPNDNFDLHNSHVLPAMIRKFHEGKNVIDYDLGESFAPDITLWGDGSAMREFLHVDDLASACLTAMLEYDGRGHLNVGTGEDITIKELSQTIADVVGFKGGIRWDTDKPNGTPKKVMSIDKIKDLGWKPSIDLKSGIQDTYKWYKKQIDNKEND